MLDQLKEDKLNIYIPTWGTDEWILCGSESLSQYVHRLNLMNQRLEALDIPLGEINEIGHDELRILPMT